MVDAPGTTKKPHMHTHTTQGKTTNSNTQSPPHDHAATSFAARLVWPRLINAAAAAAAVVVVVVVVVVAFVRGPPARGAAAYAVTHGRNVSANIRAWMATPRLLRCSPSNVTHHA